MERQVLIIRFPLYLFHILAGLVYPLFHSRGTLFSPALFLVVH